MHRDVQPDNILLALTYNLDALTKDQIQHDVGDDKGKGGYQNTKTKEAWTDMNLRRQANYMNIIERNDGEPLTIHDPLYTVAGISLLDRLEFDATPPMDFCVKLIDSGSDCKFEDCNDGKTPYPIDVRAPEVILKQPYDEKADIWALACTIFHIVTMEPLIPLWVTADKEATDDENLKNFIDCFGKLPEDLRSVWTCADQHLDKEGNLLESDECKDDNYQFGDLWQGVRLAKLGDMSTTEAKVFYDLLKKRLSYDPGKRLST
jgi:serine/threonine protein kinase